MPKDSLTVSLILLCVSVSGLCITQSFYIIIKIVRDQKDKA